MTSFQENSASDIGYKAWVEPLEGNRESAIVKLKHVKVKNHLDYLAICDNSKITKVQKKNLL